MISVVGIPAVVIAASKPAVISSAVASTSDTNRISVRGVDSKPVAVSITRTENL